MLPNSHNSSVSSSCVEEMTNQFQNTQINDDATQETSIHIVGMQLLMSRGVGVNMADFNFSIASDSDESDEYANDSLELAKKSKERRQSCQQLQERSSSAPQQSPVAANVKNVAQTFAAPSLETMKPTRISNSAA